MPFWLGDEHAHGFPAPNRCRRAPTGGCRSRGDRGVRVRLAAAATPTRPTPALTGLLYARGHGTAAWNPPAAPGTRRDDLATPLELVERYGATVEGLIFTADPDGHPT
ncbi:hypothetical protein HBB16_09915 [Pseudonocardia sp. MCCB 268]|nr:hypothetical protein [Pseudonocardia cytotoxica]